jgi:hypothetical protein
MTMSRIITDLSTEFARTGRTRTRFFTPEIAHAMRLARKHDMRMSDGLFYNDLREPFFSDLSPVTLATTAKALYTASDFPTLGGNYFAAPGKRCGFASKGRSRPRRRLVTVRSTSTTARAPTPTAIVLASSAAIALTASQTNLSWYLDITVRCITKGATGTLRVVRGLGGERRRSRVDPAASNDPGVGRAAFLRLR